ncbi:MAG TPA: TIM-barrel domain-containing protein, partial [Bacteroidales bacterium]
MSNNEFTFITDYGKAKVIVYSPNVMRIRVEKDNFTKTFSYAVVANPSKCAVKSSEIADSYVIETDSVTLKVHKKPLRFEFFTKDGKLINSDDPAFGTSWLGDEITTYKALQKDERFIGLGEQTGNLDRRGEAYFNYNTDDPGYNSGSKSLYSSIPFYIGLHSGLCYGVFLDNSSRTTFNFGAGNNRFSYFTTDCGEMDYYFIYHTNIRKIIESYTWLTGRMPMPPLWSLGYQQCRYSYFPDADVLSVAKKFRERNIPADMIYLDIHYMDQYKLFTWDKERFPNPSGMISDLKKLSFHTAVIIDPGVKVEKGYSVYEDGLKSGIFIKYPDGTYYEGNVWPGWCNFPDFTMPKAREWWGNQVKTYVDQGVTGFWNDMNEIAAWGREVPKLLQLDWEGKKTTYGEAKNTYGFLMARSSYEGAKKYMNGERPFVLTRAGYAGLQRYTAIWTGDNQSYDDHMFLGVRLLNSLGLSGVSFAGMDIGGFGGNPS